MVNVYVHVIRTLNGAGGNKENMATIIMNL